MVFTTSFSKVVNIAFYRHDGSICVKDSVQMFTVHSEVSRKDDPAIVGIITECLGNDEYQVFFNNKKVLIQGKYLILRDNKALEDEYKEIAVGSFANASALNELIVQEKMSGRLTNIFYSMHFGNTDFYPHQFKPVMKFIESMTDRLLIADEVGLGKTIEALYIWKELQVRDQARRLVVFCPSMLTTKWQHDMEVRFAMEAEIVNADALANVLEKTVASTYKKNGFMLICSMESLRIQFKKERSKLREILEKSEDEQTLFDLVIFDEAHYMRNPATSSFKIATMVRDCAEAVLLLSATPIQTSSRNLYTLLQLIAPEQFDDVRTFEHFIERNASIIHLMNALQDNSLPLGEIQQHIDDARDAEMVHPKLLNEIASLFSKNTEPPISERIALAHRVDQQSYLSSYISRSRKSEVFENRVVRDSETITFALSDLEYDQYTRASRHLSEIYGKTGIFAIIIKQRILASCLPVGIHNFSSKLSKEDMDFFLQEYDADEDQANSFSFEELLGFADFETLKETDSKYSRLVEELRETLKPIVGQNKIIIFTGFRMTADYLADRLAEDGFSVSYIRGGMGSYKYEVIEQFKDAAEPRILLSTEVGSEGIDLQFCDTIINYDLPWNPMRIEQRIGRVDRIGQKSERIKIRNIVCKSTIEDRVLERLYDRIQLFENTIGNLEEILGTEVENLIIDLSNKELTDEEIEERISANKTVQAITDQLKGELEVKAPSLASAGQYILQSIKRSDDQKHYITQQDVFSFVDGYLQRLKSDEYRLEAHPTDTYSYKIRLPHSFKRQLNAFCMNNRELRYTRLVDESSHSWYFYFNKGPEHGRSATARCEVIDIEHPLIKFISAQLARETDTGRKCSVIHLQHTTVPKRARIDRGLYSYYVELWETAGALRSFELRYFLASHDSFLIIPDDIAETVINTAAQEGYSGLSFFSQYDPKVAHECYVRLIEYCRITRNAFDEDYNQRMSTYREQRDQFIRLSFDTKIEKTEMMLQQMKQEGKIGVLPMYEGKIKKLLSQKEDNLLDNEAKQITSSSRAIAAGLISIE